LHVLGPSKVPAEPGSSVADAVPAASVSPSEVTVIVSVWSLPTAFVALCGEIWM
jgi:hypothetical protein